jgi:peroxiredoxin family protein
MTPFATALMNDKLKKLGVPTVREYLEMLCDAGANLYACKMSMDMFGLKPEDFIPGVKAIVTAAENNRAGRDSCGSRPARWVNAYGGALA